MVKSASPDVLKKELGATSAMSEETLDHEGKELLTYFANLSEEDCKGILHHLCDNNEGDAFVRRPLDMSQPSAYNTDNERAALYDNINEHHDTAVAQASRKVASHELQSGLLISLAPCSNKDLNAVNIILSKQDCGNDAIECKKTWDKVVKALEPKIAAGNISRMLTSNNAADYDVAADALSWQTTLKSISRFCQQYDMMSLLKIPQGVDFSQPQQVAKAFSFKDAIEDWKELEDKMYYQWQEFILSYSTAIKVESDNWLEEVLHLSMEKTLRAKVESDINSIPLCQRGSITTLRCIIKRMVIKNQEAKDSLENYIQTLTLQSSLEETFPQLVFV
jgi:hypothetical protein